MSKKKASFALVRVLGNDLPPMHRVGQTLENTAFLLEHEPRFEGCERWWVLNRVRDPEMRQALVELLERHGERWQDEPFEREVYDRIDESDDRVDRVVADLLAQDPDAFNGWGFQASDRRRLVKLHRKILYAMNNNGARNTALRLGRSRARWTLPFDGGCFFSAEAWQAWVDDVERLGEDYRQLVVPMVRVRTDESRSFEVLRDEVGVQVRVGGEVRPREEPQVAFREDSPLEFDERFRYGRRPKVELLRLLGVPGKWDEWKGDIAVRSAHEEEGSWAEAGVVIRLAAAIDDDQVLDVARRNLAAREAAAEKLESELAERDADVAKWTEKRDHYRETVAKRRSWLEKGHPKKSADELREELEHFSERLQWSSGKLEHHQGRREKVFQRFDSARQVAEKHREDLAEREATEKLTTVGSTGWQARIDAVSLAIERLDGRPLAGRKPELRRNPVELEVDDFVLYRILGNDLPPRHESGQAVRNLRFILDNEPELPRCEKRFVLNRIADAEQERALVALLEERGLPFLHLPYEADELLARSHDAEAFEPVDFFRSQAFRALSEVHQARALDHWRRAKNLYLMNNNGARNAALRDGRRRAKWVLPWDGNCFLTADAWTRIERTVRTFGSKRYFWVPMARCLDNEALLDPAFVPEAVEEPQLLFRRDAELEFDERRRYGRRPKVELLLRLGVPGAWEDWGVDPWEEPESRLEVEPGEVREAGWVARLYSGRGELEGADRSQFLDRGLQRLEGIRLGIAQAEEAALRRSFRCDDLALLDDATLDRQALEAREGGPAACVVGRLLREAELELDREPPSVTQKTSLPPSGDLHDYWHPAPYWWPNPDTPDGLPYVRRDGERRPGTELNAPGSEQYDRTSLQRLFDGTFTLALAWRFGGDERFAEQGARYLRSWFLDEATRMNPHLVYSQVRMGYTDNKGKGRGTIETKDFYFLLEAARLLRRSGALGEDDVTALRSWCRDFLTWLRDSPQGHHEDHGLNNHGTCYDLQCVALALYVDDLMLARDVLERSKMRLLSQLDSEGGQPEELGRTLTHHYCTFNLQSWANLARLGEACGIDLWSFPAEDGRGLRRAFEWLLPSLERDWPHEQIKPFDRERLLPLALTARARWPELELPGELPPPMAVKPVFDPHDGIRPWWSLGARELAGLPLG